MCIFWFVYCIDKGTIPSSVGSLINLQHLVIPNNKFTGNNIHSIAYRAEAYFKLLGTIPGVVGSMTALQIFQVNNNFITGISNIIFEWIYYLWFIDV